MVNCHKIVNYFVLKHTFEVENAKNIRILLYFSKFICIICGLDFLIGNGNAGYINTILSYE